MTGRKAGSLEINIIAAGIQAKAKTAKPTTSQSASNLRRVNLLKSVVSDVMVVLSGLTKKAEPPPTRDVNRDSGTDRANGGWLRRLVRPQRIHYIKPCKPLATTRQPPIKTSDNIIASTPITLKTAPAALSSVRSPPTSKAIPTPKTISGNKKIDPIDV